MARWKILKVIQQGIISDPNDFRRSGQTTILLVDFVGRGEQEVAFAPTVDRDGIIRTLSSMARDSEPAVKSGPPADDLLGLEG